MSIYARHDDPAPDADFEPGCLEHLVPGNTGRLLDARRTPVGLPNRGGTPCMSWRIRFCRLGTSRIPVRV